MREFMNRYPLVAVILVLLAVDGVGAGDFSMLRAASHDGVANGWLEGRMCCRASRRSAEGPRREPSRKVQGNFGRCEATIQHFQNAEPKKEEVGDFCVQRRQCALCGKWRPKL